MPHRLQATEDKWTSTWVLSIFSVFLWQNEQGPAAGDPALPSLSAREIIRDLRSALFFQLFCCQRPLRLEACMCAKDYSHRDTPSPFPSCRSLFVILGYKFYPWLWCVCEDKCKSRSRTVCPVRLSLCNRTFILFLPLFFPPVRSGGGAKTAKALL